jgi:DNA-binding beta-propeller fold protein YncE
MHPLSVGRFPHGLLWFALFCVGVGLGQVPAAVVISPNTARTCASGPVSFPTIELDCTHHLEYLGQFSAEGIFSPLGRHRRWYNQDTVHPANFSYDGRPLARPVEVPPYMNLQPAEHVVQNFAPPVRASQLLSGKTKLAGWRDHVVTFVYGHEQALMAPQHITVDSKGRLIVADPMIPAVHVLDGEKSFRIAAGPRRRMQHPAGVAVDANDNIYVADSGLGLIDVYDPRGNFVRYIGKIDDESLFDYPTGIAIDRANARIYLLDTPRNVLLILDLHGNILKRVGRRSTDEVPVEFVAPSEITMNGDEVVVLDSAGSRLQVFDLDGKLLRHISTNTSNGPSKVPVGMGLGTDSEGNIYLSNVRDYGVRVFSRAGIVLSSFGQAGIYDGQFDSPAGLWVEKDTLYVADTKNRRVEVFKIRSLGQELTKTVASAAP